MNSEASSVENNSFTLSRSKNEIMNDSFLCCSLNELHKCTTLYSMVESHLAQFEISDPNCKLKKDILFYYKQNVNIQGYFVGKGSHNKRVYYELIQDSNSQFIEFKLNHFNEIILVIPIRFSGNKGSNNKRIRDDVEDLVSSKESSISSNSSVISNNKEYDWKKRIQELENENADLEHTNKTLSINNCKLCSCEGSRFCFSCGNKFCNEHLSHPMHTSECTKEKPTYPPLERYNFLKK